jgi:adenine-specific DNA glycosylase
LSNLMTTAITQCFKTLFKNDVFCLQAQQSLLDWYDRVQRVLPWRRNPHHKPQQDSTTTAAAAAAEDAGGSSGSSSKQKKPSKKQLAAAAEAEAVLAAAKPAPADLPPQEFAYYVWVSEIMLQQTQVSRVVTYFNKWVACVLRQLLLLLVVVCSGWECGSVRSCCSRRRCHAW